VLTSFETGSRARRVDWILVAAALALVAAGMLTMASYGGDLSLVRRQGTWLAVSAVAFLFFSRIDARVFRRSGVALWLYGGIAVMLVALFAVGTVAKGAQSWFRIGALGFQPVEFAKLALILLLAKYFSRRHAEVKDFRHIIASGAYALGLFALVLVQPDFGGAIIIFAIWFGMTLVAGLSRKHLGAVLLAGTAAFAGLWFYGFDDYQKQRILTFVDPLADARGAGYNALQATIAVGSGEMWGKGIGFGTQSRLRYLPERHTDFIFAAFAEEWGFFGSVGLLSLYGLILWRVAQAARRGASNFESLYAAGVASYLLAHGAIHVGMNMGIAPVTGIPLPLMSYGGSSMLATACMLGILASMRGYARPAGRDAADRQEIPGLTG
jgi:rod shape determining protein RodA